MTIENDKIALKFQLDQTEWESVTRFMTQEIESLHPYPRLRHWLGYLVIVLYILAGMVLLVTMAEVRFDQDTAKARTGWILVVAGLIGAAWWITRVLYNWSDSGSYWRSHDLYTGDVSFNADLDGVTFDYGAVQSSVGWVAIRGTETVGDTLLVVMTDGQAVPIPDTAFADEDDRKSFVAWAGRQIETAHTSR